MSLTINSQSKFAPFYWFLKMTKNIIKHLEFLAKQGGFRQVKKIDNSDKNTIHLPRQE